jgi:hypothetical protein
MPSSGQFRENPSIFLMDQDLGRNHIGGVPGERLGERLL